jgi:hypothetical protein
MNTLHTYQLKKALPSGARGMAQTLFLTFLLLRAIGEEILKIQQMNE